MFFVLLSCDSLFILSNRCSFVKHFFIFLNFVLSSLSCDSLFILSKCFAFVKNFFHNFFNLFSKQYLYSHVCKMQLTSSTTQCVPRVSFDIISSVSHKVNTFFIFLYIFFLIVFTQLYIVFTYLSTYHLLLMYFSLLCIITPV